MEIIPIQVLIDDFKKSDAEEYDWQDDKIFKFKMHDRGFIGEPATFDDYMEEKIKDMS
jgi:hypothetical protein